MVEIKVSPVVVYEVKAPDGTLVVFRRSSKWEGFERWDSENGSMIVTDSALRSPFSDMFKNIFKVNEEPMATYRVVSASPALISLFEMESCKTTPAEKVI